MKTEVGGLVEEHGEVSSAEEASPLGDVEVERLVVEVTPAPVEPEDVTQAHSIPHGTPQRQVDGRPCIRHQEHLYDLAIPCLGRLHLVHHNELHVESLHPWLQRRDQRHLGHRCFLSN